MQASYRCNMCHGQGETETSADLTLMPSVMETCETCKGTGTLTTEVEAGDPCWYCKAAPALKVMPYCCDAQHHVCQLGGEADKATERMVSLSRASQPLRRAWEEAHRGQRSPKTEDVLTWAGEVLRNLRLTIEHHGGTVEAEYAKRQLVFVSRAVSGGAPDAE